jgi:predicted SnoaL-like aldol condensation-catalyzing enzyme
MAMKKSIGNVNTFQSTLVQSCLPIQNSSSKEECSMSPARMSKVEAAMRTVLAFNDAFNRHNVPEMMKLMSDNCVFENTDPAPDGTQYSGKEAVTQFWQNFFRESHHAHIAIEEIFSLGSRCIMRWKYNWEDLEGSRGHVRGVDIFRVEEGLILEKLSYVKG